MYITISLQSRLPLKFIRVINAPAAFKKALIKYIVKDSVHYCSIITESHRGRNKSRFYVTSCPPLKLTDSADMFGTIESYVNHVITYHLVQRVT